MAISSDVPTARLPTRTPHRPTADDLPARLIEREAPLDELRRLLERAQGGSGGVVVVRGEAGIGKSALVDAFLDEVGEVRDPVTTLTGRCDGVTTPRPLGPLRDMAPKLGNELSRMLDADTELHVVSAWLERRLAAVEPVVMVVEDLQWVDEATAETLTYLARRVADRRQLVIVTYRDDDEPAPTVRRVLGQLAAMRGATNLALRPLSSDGVATLAAETSADPAQVHRLTGGNPFYVTQLLLGDAAEVPQSISDILKARLDRLTPRARAALEAAAIIGARAEPWLLAAVAGEDVLGADECIAAGLLAKGDYVSFRHELTRLAVLDALPVFRGIGLHRRALDVLLRNGTRDDGRLAYHAEGAADAGSVLRHATAAGRAAMRVGANNEAVAQFERAVRFLDHAPDDRVRAEILEQLSYAQYQTDRIPEAYDNRRMAIELRRSLGDDLAVGDGLRHFSRLAWTRGFGDEARAADQEALRILEPLGDSRELAMAYANVGGLAMVVRDTVEAHEYTERALEMGRRLNEPEPIAYALNSLGCLAFTEGRPGGEELMLESLRIAREHALFESAHRAYYNLFVNLADVREPMRALDYLMQLLDYTSGVQVERCNLDCALSEIRLSTGEWDEAERLARSALEYALTQTDDKGSGMVTLALLAIRRGDGGAEELLAEAERAFDGFESMAHMLPVVLARTESAWLAGTMHEVVVPLQEALAWAVAASDPWNTGEIGCWLWQAGALAEPPAGAAEPYAKVVRGQNAEAATDFDARSLPYQAALALAMSSRPDDLRAAHERLVALGATAVARKVADLLRAAGEPAPRGPRNRTRSNPGGLTDRELEVAQLLANGLTNRQIAESLFVTEKTVGHHVSAVLARLGVERRGQVAGRLAAED